MIDAGGLPDAFEPPPTAPELSIDPALQDFGDVVVDGTSDPATFTITNVGDGPSAQITATLGGAGAAAYAFVSNGCAGMTLAPGADCDVTIEFAPEAEGRAMATLDVTDGDVRTAATLQGRGVPDAGLSISPSPHNFGRTTVGTATAAQAFTVTNTGAVPSAAIAAALGGTDPGQFRISMDNCAGMMLAAGGNCTVEVEYDPSTAGSHMATLGVTAGPASINASLLGTADDPAGLRISPLMASYGSAPTGTASAPQTFTVTNTGGVTTGMLMNTLGGADAGEFSISGSTCAGLTLGGGDSCMITVVWTAGAAGDKAATLTVTDGALMAVSTLSAVAVTPGTIVLEPPTRDFGTSAIGTGTGGTTFTARNPGGTDTGVLTVAIAGTNPGDFRIVSDGCSASVLAPMGACTVAVEFLPTASGSRSATLRVTGTPGGTGMAALSGNGESPAVFELTPTAHNYGSIATGSAGVMRTFTVRNTGTASSGVPTVSLTGLGSVHFRILSNTCTGVLAGLATCDIIVNYEPTALGAHTAVLEVTGSPGGRDTADLGGTGITPAALQFALGFSSVNFLDTTETDVSANGTLRVTNAGQATTGALAVALAPTTDFSIVTDGCNGMTLAGSASCDIAVRFGPAVNVTPFVAARTANVTVMGAPGGMLTGPLTGNARRDLELIPTPPATTVTAFAQTNIGGSNFVTWRFRNNTSRSITFGAAPYADAGTFAAEFAADYANSTCDGATVTAGNSCDLRITFTPTGTPGTRNATTFTLTGTSTFGTHSETYDLTATALGPLFITQIVLGTTSATLPAAPAACNTTLTTPAASTVADFGNTQVTGSFREARFCFYNSNTASLGGAIRTASSFTGALQIVADSCTGSNLPTAPRYCSVVVRYFPQAPAGTVSSGSITLTYGAGAIDVGGTVTGTSAAAGTVTVDATPSTAYGGVVATTSLDRTFTFRNSSAVNNSPGVSGVAVESSGVGVNAPTQWSLVPAAAPFAANDCRNAAYATGLTSTAVPATNTCTLTVRFTPVPTNNLTSSYTQRVRLNLTGVATASDPRVDVSGTTLQYLTIDAPDVLAFGSVPQGVAQPAQAFTIRYSGVGTSPPISCLGTGGATGDYAITNSCPVGGLAMGTTCTCSLVLNGTTPGDRGATFTVSAGANAPQQDTGTTTATVLNPPNLAVSPGNIAFGSVRVGGNSGDVAVTVTNLSGNTMSPGMITTTLAGTQASEFEIRPGSSCGPALAPNGTCTFSVRFNPTLACTTAGGCVRGGSLAAAGITVDDGSAVPPLGSSPVNFHLTGRAMPPTGNGLSLITTPTTFGTTTIGTPVTRTFTVFNNGTANSGAIAYTIGNAEFTKVAGDCTASLAPGGSCTFTVTWTPTGAAGTRATFVQAVAAGFEAGTAEVTGIAQAAPAIGLFVATTPFTAALANPLNFGNVATGTTSDITFIVRNTVSGSADTSAPAATAVTFTGSGSARFSQQSMTCSTTRGLSALDATAGSGNDECRITIRYAPTVVGSNSATATVNFGPGASLTRTFTVQGSGVVNAVLGINVTTAQTCTTGANQALSNPVQCTGGTWTDYTISNGGDVAFAGPLTIGLTGAFQTGGAGTTCVNGITTLQRSGVAGDTCVIRVQHLPDDLAADTGTLTVSAPVPGAALPDSVTATINATSSSALVGTGTITYAGTTSVGAASAATTLTYTYNANASVSSQPITWRFDSVAGPQSADFDVTSDTCSGRVLAAGNTCQLQVVFRPSGTTPNPRVGTLIVDDGRDYVRSTLTLTGTAAP